MTLASRCFVVLASGALTVCASAWGGEAGRPAGGIAWEEAAGVPPWVLAPPSREGFASFVDAAQSNLLHLAGGNEAHALAHVRSECRHRLAAVLGADAERVAERGITKVHLARKGFYLQKAKPAEALAPGAATYTAWRLWEIEIEPVLVAVAEEKRAAVNEALRVAPRLELRWDGAGGTPQTKDPDLVTVTLTEDSDRLDVAKVNALILGPARLAGRLTEAMTATLGPKEAFRLAREAVTWRSIAGRGVEKSADPTVWIRWAVPLARITENVQGAEARAAVLTALREMK